MNKKGNSNGVSRRAANSLLAGAGLATASLPVVHRAAWARTDPLVMTWAGWDDPNLFQAYVDEYGSAPSFTFFSDLEGAFQKVRAGFSADAISIGITGTKRWVDAGLIEPIDPERLEHWDDFYEPMKNLDSQWIDGELYFIPTMYGGVSILYRSDIVDVEQESWSMLWDERYAGLIAPIDFPVEALVQIGLGMGMPNPWAMNDEELEAVAATLKKQMQLSKFYWSDPTTVEQALVTGEIAIAAAWSEMAPRVTGQGVPIVYANPVEGRIATLDGLTISSNRKADLDRIYSFINARTSPAAGAYCMTSFGMVNPNRKARDLASPEIVQAMGADNIGATMAVANDWKTMDENDIAKYIQIYDETRAGF